MTCALVAWLAIATPAVAGSDWAGTCGVTDRFEVIATNPAKGLVAYKHVFHDDRAEEESIDCGYAGMKDTPSSAVELGVYDVATGKTTESWTVYALAYKPSECSSHDASKAQLDAAKARFAALGLDLEAKPAPTTIDHKAEQVAVQAANRKIELKLVKDRRTDDEEMMAYFSAAILAGDRKLHERKGEYFYGAGGSMDIRYVDAYPYGNDALLVELHYSWSMRHQEQCYELVRVSP